MKHFWSCSDGVSSQPICALWDTLTILFIPGVVTDVQLDKNLIYIQDKKKVIQLVHDLESILRINVQKEWFL